MADVKRRSVGIDGSGAAGAAARRELKEEEASNAVAAAPAVVRATKERRDNRDVKEEFTMDGASGKAKESGFKSQEAENRSRSSNRFCHGATEARRAAPEFGK